MKRFTFVPAAFAVLAGLATAGCTPAPSVTVTPSTDLVDGQQVAVDGAGYSANATVGIVQCPTGADSIDDCDSDTAKTLSTDSQGRYHTTTLVKAVIVDGHGVSIDCAAEGSCVVASVYVHGFQGLATAALTFR